MAQKNNLRRGRDEIWKYVQIEVRSVDTEYSQVFPLKWEQYILIRQRHESFFKESLNIRFTSFHRSKAM